MSIYIPGMEMPKNCSECGQFRWSNLLQSEVCRIAEAIRGDGIFQSASEGIDNRPSWCPLFPVPDHGRLGDLDALPGQMLRNLFEIEDKAEKELGFDQTLRRGMQYGHAVCVDAVNDAPTVIPADKEEQK